MFSGTPKKIDWTLGPVAGGISLLLFGGQALLVWHGGPALIPDFPWMNPPIQYDAAWAFALCGMGLLAFGGSVPILTGLCAVGVFVIGLVRLLHFLIPGLGISVTPVLAHSWLPAGPHDDLSLLVALAFIISGYAIGALKYRPYSAVRSVVLECMALVLLVMVPVFIFGSQNTGLSTHEWLRMDNRDAVNAIGFLVVGASILYFVFFGSGEEVVKARRWAPVAIWLAACAGPVALWQGMRVEENRQIRFITQAVSDAVEREIAREINSRILSLQYLGTRWSVLDVAEQQWREDVQQMLQTNRDFESISWVEPDLTVRWILPEGSRDRALSQGTVNGGGERKSVLIRAVELDAGKWGLHIRVPVFNLGKFQGWLAITLGHENWLETFLGNRFPRHAITLSQGGVTIGRIRLKEAVPDADWAYEQPFDLHNAHWVLRVVPTRVHLDSTRTALPEIALGVGVLLATLLAIAVFLIQVAVGRTRSLARVNKLLALDIDARKQVQEALRESERKLRIIVDGVQDHAIFMLDEHGRISTWNKAAQQLTGYAAAEAIGRNLTLLYPDDDEEEELSVEEKLARAESVGSYSGECWHLRKNGSRFCGDDSISAIRGNDGVLEGFAVITRDQTENIELRRETERARDYYFRLFSSFPNLVWRTDASGQCDYCNPAWLSYTGRTQEQEAGVGWTEGLHPDDLALWTGAFEQSQTDRQPFEIQYRLRRADGQYGWIICSCKPYYNMRGEFAGFLGACYDNTIRRRMEDEVETSRERILAFSRHLQTAREEEKARLARELHDELGATLTALRLEISSLFKQLPAGDGSQPARSAIQLADSAIQAIRRIITDLRPSILDNLGLLAALRWQAGEFSKRTGIRVELHISDGENNVGKAQALAFFRIFQEALTNVLKHAQAANVTVSFTRSGGNDVLQIVDDGIGMSIGRSEKLFSHGIVGMRERARELHGEVVIISTPGKGTKVTATLPAHP